MLAIKEICVLKGQLYAQRFLREKLVITFRSNMNSSIAKLPNTECGWNHRLERYLVDVGVYVLHSSHKDFLFYWHVFLMHYSGTHDLVETHLGRNRLITTWLIWHALYRYCTCIWFWKKNLKILTFAFHCQGIQICSVWCLLQVTGWCRIWKVKRNDNWHSYTRIIWHLQIHNTSVCKSLLRALCFLLQIRPNLCLKRHPAYNPHYDNGQHMYFRSN